MARLTKQPTHKLATNLPILFEYITIRRDQEALPTSGDHSVFFLPLIY